jgi:hypothetical protein
MPNLKGLLKPFKEDAWLRQNTVVTDINADDNPLFIATSRVPERDLGYTNVSEVL